MVAEPEFVPDIMAELEPFPEVVAGPETVPGVVAELGETVEVATAPGSVAKPEAVKNPSVCLTEAVMIASACPTGSPGPGALGTESPGPCSPVSCFLDLVPCVKFSLTWCSCIKSVRSRHSCIKYLMIRSGGSVSSFGNMVLLLPCQVEGSPALMSSFTRSALQKLFLVWWLDYELLLDQKLFPN